METKQIVKEFKTSLIMTLIIMGLFCVFIGISMYYKGYDTGIREERNRFNNIPQWYGKDVRTLYKDEQVHIPDSCTLGFRHGDTLYVWDYTDPIEGFRFAGKFTRVNP